VENSEKEVFALLPKFQIFKIEKVIFGNKKIGEDLSFTTDYTN